MNLSYIHRPEKILPFYGACASLFFWLSDAIIDFYIFDEFGSIFESVLFPESHELYMRISVVILFAIFTIIALKLVKQQQSISSELEKQKNQLEEIVLVRTESLEKLATTDELTDVFNRRKFNELLGYEIERYNRYRHPFSFVILDIDYFKKVNDQFGHQVGDDILVSVALVLKGITRKSDVVARLGGEEFGIILPDTDEGTAYNVADKIRMNIENAKFSKIEKLTLSAGVTEYVANQDMKDVFYKADQALYEAKNSGRNRVFASSSLSFIK